MKNLVARASILVLAVFGGVFCLTGTRSPQAQESEQVFHPADYRKLLPFYYSEALKNGVVGKARFEVRFRGSKDVEVEVTSYDFSSSSGEIEKRPLFAAGLSKQLAATIRAWDVPFALAEPQTVEIELRIDPGLEKHTRSYIVEHNELGVMTRIVVLGPRVASSEKKSRQR